jgi:hypothetical protein
MDSASPSNTPEAPGDSSNITTKKHPTNFSNETSRFTGQTSPPPPPLPSTAGPPPAPPRLALATDRFKVIDDTPNVYFTDSAAPEPNARISIEAFLEKAVLQHVKHRRFGLEKAEALLRINFGAGWLSENWDAILRVRP